MLIASSLAGTSEIVTIGAMSDRPETITETSELPNTAESTGQIVEMSGEMIVGTIANITDDMTTSLETPETPEICLETSQPLADDLQTDHGLMTSRIMIGPLPDATSLPKKAYHQGPIRMATGITLIGSLKLPIHVHPR